MAPAAPAAAWAGCTDSPLAAALGRTYDRTPGEGLPAGRFRVRRAGASSPPGRPRAGAAARSARRIADGTPRGRPAAAREARGRQTSTVRRRKRPAARAAPAAAWAGCTDASRALRLDTPGRGLPCRAFVRTRGVNSQLPNPNYQGTLNRQPSRNHCKVARDCDRHVRRHRLAQAVSDRRSRLAHLLLGY